MGGTDPFTESRGYTWEADSHDKATAFRSRFVPAPELDIGPLMEMEQMEQPAEYDNENEVGLLRVPTLA